MKHSVKIILPFVLSIIISCNDTKTKTLGQQIKDLEETLYLDNFPNKEKILSLVGLYENFYRKNPKSEQTPVYLLSAGKLGKILNDANKSNEYFDIIINQYPQDTTNYALAIFYKATVLDDLTNENEEAIKYYQLFINKFPNHPLSSSAKELILLSGKSLNEIVNSFEKKNKNLN